MVGIAARGHDHHVVEVDGDSGYRARNTGVRNHVVVVAKEETATEVAELLAAKLP